MKLAVYHMTGCVQSQIGMNTLWVSLQGNDTGRSEDFCFFRTSGCPRHYTHYFRVVGDDITFLAYSPDELETPDRSIGPRRTCDFLRGHMPLWILTTETLFVQLSVCSSCLLRWSNKRDRAMYNTWAAWPRQRRCSHVTLGWALINDLK